MALRRDPDRLSTASVGRSPAGNGYDTVTLVFVGIWNGLLLGALLFVLWRRARLLRWVTGADGEDRGSWKRRDEWTEFLAQHPELTDDHVRVVDQD